MRWITDSTTFDRLFLEAERCVRLDDKQLPEVLRRLVFDSSELCTSKFWGLLQRLMKQSQDTVCYYIVLSPDPVAYFKANFGKYPLIEISSTDSVESFLAALGEDQDGSPADAVGVNWSEYAIVSASRNWFIRGIRDDFENAGGHLVVPEQWTCGIINAYPYATLAR